MLTLNQIIAQIQTLAAAHAQISSSGVGDKKEWENGRPDRVYPILWINSEGRDISDQYVTDRINLICADRVRAGEEGDNTDGHEQEVISDRLTVMLDIIAWFVQQHGQQYIIERSGRIEPFTEEGPDRVAGCGYTLNIKQIWDFAKCPIPESGAVIPPTVDGLTLYDFCDASVLARLTPAQVACLEAAYGNTCDPVIVEINGTEVGTPASGSTFSVKVTLDGTEAGSWDGVDTWEVTSGPCADGTITINGDSYGTVPSGGTENIEVVTDATPSSPVGSLVSGQWVIGNAHMHINGTNVGNIEAEGTANKYVKVNGTQIGSWNNPTQTWNIIVKQDGVQVGSNVGNEWIVPACPTANALSLATSSATPAYGASFTITATATGLTPISYTFSYPSDSIGGYARTTQAGNALAITARGYSTQTIMVTATDGVTTVGATIQVTVAQMTQVTDFLTNTGIVDATITGAVRSLALRLDDYGIWSKVRALYPFVGGTATTHKYNLKDPRDLDAAYRLVFSGGWTHDSNGVTGNGTNTSADSKLANNVTGQNSLTMGVYNRTAGTGGVEWSGSVTPRTWLAGNISGTAYFDINNGASTATTTAPADVRGTLMASRVVSTATELNLNGQGQRTTAATSSAPAATNFILGQFSGGGFNTARNYAAAWLTDGLNAEEETHFRSAMQTFQTTLIRNV